MGWRAAEGRISKVSSGVLDTRSVLIRSVLALALLTAFLIAQSRGSSAGR